MGEGPSMGAVQELFPKKQSQEWADFSEFWKWQVWKIKKLHCERLWAQMSLEERRLAAEQAMLHYMWHEENGTDRQFWPRPYNWLEGKRFYDELPAKEVKNPCRWPSCDGVGKHQHGTASYCEKHFQAVKRGETPGR